MNWKEAIDQSSVYDVAIVSPLEFAPLLSQKYHASIYLKREDLQPVFSFKLRGAYQKLTTIPSESLKKGVIAASAGNHAQGVAYGAKYMGIPATIVMPKTAPLIKVNAVKRMGAMVELVGTAYDDAYAHAMTLCQRNECTFLHPFDDEAVIVGQGTVGKELFEQVPDLDMVVVPVGGGGLLAGIVAYFKSVSPQTRIVGVEPDDAACMTAALLAGQLVELDEVGIFVDGVAVKKAGKANFDVVKGHIHRLVTVSTDEVCAAIKDIFEETRVACEPSGALALAGLKKLLSDPHEKIGKVAVVVSGANLSFDRLQHIAERATLGEGKEMMMLAEIPEVAGSFKSFCRQLGPHAITEFNYRYQDSSRAVVLVGLQIDQAGRQRLLAHLCSTGVKAIDISDDEMAKVHLRHMVGGQVSILNERLFHVEFPERPGALLRFLTKLGSDCSITLFHYRNHGADYGRVLLGMSVHPSDYSILESRLNDIGYPWRDYSDAKWVSLLFKTP